MKARSLTAVSIVAFATWIASCSSGLGNNLPTTSTSTTANTNLPLGLDIGLTPTSPVVEPAVAGVVVPAIGATPQRDVILLAFTTAARADNGDGAGTLLSRDTVTDTNTANDVFVAAISAQDVERRAFSQSLAGKFRHPRCTTCHSMQAADTLAFVSSPQPHAGPPPGPTFPNNDPSTCATCHVTSSTFPVPTWQAPAASFDLRRKTVAELAVAAQQIPAGDPEHFVSDKRVLWALDSGILPQVGGRNGVADDDHDGVFEPEDIDGIPRTVPGGSAAFLREIEDWHASGKVLTAASAVKDITLVSRATGTNNAGNGASDAPRVVWVPNPAFDPTNATTAAATNPIGTLYVAYQSTASNLVAGDGNGAMDVFRTAVQLRAEEDANGNALAGGLNVRMLDTTILCSTINTTTTAGNGASGRPSIGGANGEWVAFESVATNLVAGFTNGNGAAKDVFVRRTDINQTLLVSHATSGAAAGGNGASEAPSIDASGRAVAFESDATNLVADDTNAVRDVFYATLGAGSPFTKVRASVTSTGAQGSGGASTGASVHASDVGRVRVAFTSAKTDLAAGLVAASNVYLFDSDTSATTLLNQRISPAGNAIGDGSARNAVIGSDGAAVAFESDATNLDVLRPDGNRATDVFLVETAQLASGNVLPYRFSLTTAEAADANGASTAPQFGAFTGSGNYRVGFAAYTTAATNLGTSDTTNVVLAFLDETSGVLADYDVTPTVGRAPLQVQFTDTSSGQPTSWQWDFDNNGSVDSTQQNPRHTYTTPGNYTVRLVARSQNSEGSVTASSPIRVLGPTIADFTVSSTTGAAPLTVVFTDASSEAFGSITAWAWDFDDNGSVDSTAQNPSFNYSTPGTYSVKLTVTGEGGTATTTKSNLITVGPPGPVTADFTSVRSGYDNQSIAFTDTSIGTVTTWSWNFGDGGTSTLQSPNHTFATPGTYTVSLTVTGPGGSDGETKPNWFTSVASSVTVAIPASKDASIYSEATGNGNGANPQIVCGNAASLAAAQFGIRRAMIEFDVAGNVPAGSTILSTALTLNISFVPTNPTGAQTIALRRMTREWGEGTTNGGIGGGGAATGGDATWAQAVSGTTSWTTAGGDFVGTISASRSVNAAGSYTWSSTSTLVADVQGWLDNTNNNHGWILRSSEVSGTRTTKVFDSRTNATLANRPSLSITYRPPLP
jgi:PKD repeat protein